MQCARCHQYIRRRVERIGMIVQLLPFRGGILRSDTTLLSCMTEWEVACKIKVDLRSNAQASRVLYQWAFKLSAHPSIYFFHGGINIFQAALRILSVTYARLFGSFRVATGQERRRERAEQSQAQLGTHDGIAKKRMYVNAPTKNSEEYNIFGLAGANYKTLPPGMWKALLNLWMLV